MQGFSPTALISNNLFPHCIQRNVGYGEAAESFIHIICLKNLFWPNSFLNNRWSNTVRALHNTITSRGQRLVGSSGHVISMQLISHIKGTNYPLCPAFILKNQNSWRHKGKQSRGNEAEAQKKTRRWIVNPNKRPGFHNLRHQFHTSKYSWGQLRLRCTNCITSRETFSPARIKPQDNGRPADF